MRALQAIFLAVVVAGSGLFGLALLVDATLKVLSEWRAKVVTKNPHIS